MPDRFPRALRSCSQLQDLVQPSLQAGFQRALPLRRSGEELSVTILVSPDYHSSRLSWNVSVHLSNYVARSTPSPAQAAMLGSGRALPLGKYSAWLSARESLEKAKPVGATEILLSNDGDGLLEGFGYELLCCGNDSWCGGGGVESSSRRWSVSWRDLPACHRGL